MFKRKLITLMILSVMAMAGESVNPENEDSSQRTANVCHTPGCVKAAEEISSNLDKNGDPCDDFYQFACGGWKDRQEITEDRPGIYVITVLQDRVDNNLQNLMKEEVTESEPDYIRKSKQIYQSCMDLESIKAVGGEPLKKALETLGGWPVVEGESWNGENFDWIDALILMRQMGYDHNILLGLFILPDSMNNTKQIITLDQGSLGMPDPSYLQNGLEDDATAAYYRLMVDLAEKLGADRLVAETQLKEAVNFEINLANALFSEGERRNVSQEYNIYSVKTLQENVPQIDWMKFFNGLLLEPISEEEPIVIVNPDFVSAFADLLHHTDKRVLANYIAWRVAQQTLPALSEEWLSLEQPYQSVLKGTVQEPNRDETCFYELMKFLRVAMSSIYVRNYFQKESKQGAIEITNYIQREFIDTFDNIQWMPQETRRYAKEKVNAMKKYIGYPNELLNDTLVSDLFSQLIITADESYYENIMKLRKWKIDEEFSHLRQPNLKGGWKEHAEVDMAFPQYNPLDNSIDIPAALLQDPYFDVNRPQYLNFGGSGYAIADRISQQLGEEGRQYDKFGNTFNWWDKETDQQFMQRTECLIKQYSNYTTNHGVKVDGVSTLETNIGNNLALKEAYKAYQTWVKDHGPEPQLPGLNFSPNQLFWISAATLYCSKTRPEFDEHVMIVNKLPPFEFSINGPVSNLPEFANDFQCGINAKMNPENKCKIWE